MNFVIDYPRLVALAAVFALSACGNSGDAGSAATANESPAKAESPAATAETEKELTESARANAFFERVFDERVARSPEFQSYLGIKDDYGKWNDRSDARALEDHELTQKHLAELRADFDYEKLDASTRKSYDIFVDQSERRIRGFEWRHHSYPVNQMGGAQSSIPAFLINIHRVDSESDAQAYIDRLNGVGAYIDEVITNLKTRASKGVVVPRFVFPLVLGDIDNVVKGAPFDQSVEESTLLADFTKKVGGLGLDADRRDSMIDAATKALIENVGPAYGRLSDYLRELQQQANTDDGAWKFPSGDKYYQYRLEMMTTTGLTADEIHEIGLREVGRIHDEMKGIMRAVGFEGTLQEFFEYLRTADDFYFSDSEEGRDAYLAEATAVIDTMKSQLSSLFNVAPKADMIVKRVEGFRERSAGKAFYQRPAPDGSRPGVYYVNLYKMESMPTYQMEALAYHEGIPGHHMQLAIAQEAGEIPKFRRYARYTAYTEGWALYAELLPKELGFYHNPYSDFGRLAMELWRAARLVVDTGIHEKRWTREKAINFLMVNTPNPEGDAIKAIERYIVMPGQATAYKIGMLKIVELRERAREALGSNFDIRGFHDVVLTSGPVPLGMLEAAVDDWVSGMQGAG